MDKIELLSQMRAGRFQVLSLFLDNLHITLIHTHTHSQEAKLIEAGLCLSSLLKE